MVAVEPATSLWLLSNPVFGFGDDVSNGLGTCSGNPCAAPVVTGTTTITGDMTDEDVVSMDKNCADVSFQSGCPHTCWVQRAAHPAAEARPESGREDLAAGAGVHRGVELSR